jgi:hypothetical protein
VAGELAVAHTPHGKRVGRLVGRVLKRLGKPAIAGRAQRFLGVHAAVHNTFYLPPSHLPIDPAEVQSRSDDALAGCGRRAREID